MNFSFFTVFLKNRNISSKIKRSKVKDNAALKMQLVLRFFPQCLNFKCFQVEISSYTKGEDMDSKLHARHSKDVDDYSSSIYKQ